MYVHDLLAVENMVRIIMLVWIDKLVCNMSYTTYQCKHHVNVKHSCRQLMKHKHTLFRLTLAK